MASACPGVFKLQGKDNVVVIHFGEGGTSQGDFMEAANLAGVVKAPAIFFCQNNQWAISTHRDWQTASATFAQKAMAFGFPGVLVDGNDLFAIYEACRDAAERARKGEGPTLIEGMTYRLGIHTTADSGDRYEPPELREYWKDKDPLLRMKRYLERRGKWNEEIEASMEAEIKAELDAAWKEAQQEPPPRIEDSFKYVFAEMPARLRQQAEALEEIDDA